MAINRDTFIHKFVEEVKDNISIIDDHIIQLKSDLKNEDLLNALLRSLHSIKGSSRMLKFNTIEKIAHGMENVFKGIKEGRYEIDNNIIQLVFISTDYFNAALNKIKNDKDDTISVAKLLAVFQRAYQNEYYTLDDLPLISDTKKESDSDKVTSEQVETTVDASDLQPKKIATLQEETIRIKIDTINTLIQQMNSVVVKQFQFHKWNVVMHDFTEQMSQLFDNIITEVSVNKSQSQHVVKIKEIGKKINSLRKSFSEDLALLEQATFTVHEEILRLNMLPLELILSPLRKMVEKTALSLGKSINFKITDANVMIDKFILENLQDPVIHLVRNSIDHGIELPEEREKNKKDPQGTIEIICASESGTITIVIKDDGKGIDYEKIRQKAISLNPAMEEEIRFMDYNTLQTFIFTPGFSTSQKATEISGRGVGMDIVKFNIEKVKGKIAVKSEKGKGTAFTLTLPLTLATVEGFFIKAGKKKFLIPSNFVHEIVIVHENEMIDLLQSKAVKVREHIIPTHNLVDLFGDKALSDSEDLFIVIVETMGEMVGVVVDEILEFNSLIYKPLPRNLRKLTVLQGIVFDEKFDIVSILFMPEIVKRFKNIKNIASKKRYERTEAVFTNILVVDDSDSTRSIIKTILENEQYRVITAVDGIDALEKLHEHHIGLVLTDVKMPRMDGITLIENMQRNDAYNKIPVIVITSIQEEESEKEALSVGAKLYLKKSEFNRDRIVSEVSKILG